MQIKKRFYAAFLVVLLTASSILIFICLNLLTSNQNNPLVPIPDNANWVLRLDAESVVKKEIYNTLFAEKDDAFIIKLRELIEKNLGDDSDKGSLHIDFQEDIVVYSVDRDNNRFLLIALQTTDPEAFNQNIPDYCKSNQAGAAKGNCALVIQQINGKNDAAKLQATLKNILDQPFKELKKAAAEKNEFIALNVKKLPATSAFSSLNLSVQHQDSEINLEGEVAYRKKVGPGLKFGLKPKGVYVYSRFIPEKLPDTLLNFLPDGLSAFKDIQAFALDFNGTYLEDIKENMPNNYGFLLVPTMNLIVQTKNNCDVTELWNSFPESVKGPDLSLNFGNTVYHLKQLSADTYFIGVDPNAVIPYSGDEILSLRGNLEKITKVYGGVFVTAVIEGLGPVRVFNDFLKSTEFVQLKVGPKKGAQFALQGQIKFKPNKLPLHEMTKMTLNMLEFAEQYSNM